MINETVFSDENNERLVRTYRYNDEIGELPVPTRAGWIFGGWWTQPSGGGDQITDENSKVTQNITYYANWIQSENTSDIL